jgi:hypothetical protein
MLKTLATNYWELCRLKRSPADTPYSVLLLLVFSCLYFILLQYQWHIYDIPQLKINRPLQTGILILISYILYVWIVLKCIGKSNRFIQTATSLMAVHAIMHIFLIALLMLLPAVLPDTPMNEVEQLGTVNLFFLIFFGVISLAITIWQFVVIIYVLKKAMDSDQVTAVLVTFGLLIFSNIFSAYMSKLL